MRLSAFRWASSIESCGLVKVSCSNLFPESLPVNFKNSIAASFRKKILQAFAAETKYLLPTCLCRCTSEQA